MSAEAAPAATERRPPLSVLVAYPYLTGTLRRRFATAGPGLEVLIDSGAFTAWTAGTPIALDDYCTFLDGLPFRPWRYFMLDVVGDPAATLRNYEAMRRRGFAPIPIFTRGAPVEHLDAYAADADLIGLGGLVSKSQPPFGYIKALAPRLQGRAIHPLGFTSPNWLKWLRPYSADSSGWLAAGRYGTVNLYMGRGVMVNLQPRAMAGPPAAPVAARLRRYGFEPGALKGADAGRGGNSVWQRITTMSWVEFSIDCRVALGTRLFLVVTSGQRDLDLLARSYETVLAARQADRGPHVRAA